MDMTLQWDKAEYNFFMELADDEKVYYLYDWLFHSEEFADDWEDEQSQDEGGDIWDYENDEELQDDVSPLKVDVILTDSHFIINCIDKGIKERTLRMFIMDGYMLLHQHDKGTASVYQLIDKGSPISSN